MAGVTYLRYTVLTSSKKSETAVHSCDPALSVSVILASRDVFSTVSEGARFKGVKIDDAFFEDHSVSLGFFDCFQGFGVSISSILVGIVYGDDSWFFEGCSDFVDDVGFEKVKVQLGLPRRVEDEATYLAFRFSVLCFVAVIIGASGSNLDDVIPGFQFAGEFAEIITRGWQLNSKWPKIKFPEIVTLPTTSQVGQAGNLGGGGGVDGMRG